MTFDKGAREFNGESVVFSTNGNKTIGRAYALG